MKILKTVISVLAATFSWIWSFLLENPSIISDLAFSLRYIFCCVFFKQMLENDTKTLFSSFLLGFHPKNPKVESSSAPRVEPKLYLLSRDQTFEPMLNLGAVFRLTLIPNFRRIQKMSGARCASQNGSVASLCQNPQRSRSGSARTGSARRTKGLNISS